MNDSQNQPSLLGNFWKIRPSDPALNIVQNILKNRGIEDQEAVQAYLSPNYKKGFHNPFLLKGMDKAVERLQKAIKEGEKIIVFGDYDVDGISGTAVLIKTLTLLGAKVSYRLPHRVNDGYGLSTKYIEEFGKLGVSVLITVDCGISCHQQISLAKSLGIDVIITDHHTLPEIFPDQAYSVLHPKQPGCEYPFKGLTGSGVAYKLASALITAMKKGEEREELLYQLLDLASLGTVADMGPLLDENRIIVKYGLEAMRNSRWAGLRHLMDSARVDSSQKLSVTDIGFKIGPRINAAGRIDSPYFALQLLLHDGEHEKGKSLAGKLERLNQTRQEMVIKALEEAQIKLAETPPDKKILIAWSPDWHVGILGLLASRMVEKFHLPVIIMQEFENHLVASFRSTEILNAYDALLASKSHLSHFGGHAQAAGFSLDKENLPAFISTISEYANRQLQAHQPQKKLNIDAEIGFSDINDQFVKLIFQMEPFGIGNERPIFILKGIKPANLKRVGKDKNHLHLLIGDQTSSRLSGIAFRLGEYHDQLEKLQKVDFAFHLDKNQWNGLESLQLQILDFRPSIL